MSNAFYEFDCLYCSGDPRLDETFVQARVLLFPDGIKLETDKNSLFWPKSGIRNALYQPRHPVDIDAIAKGSIEAAEDIAVGLAMDVPPEPAVTLTIQDPEGVYEDGFEISLVFEKEYNARVLAKRIADNYCAS